MSRSAGKARTQLSKKGGHMKSIAYSLLLLAILSGCGSTTESTGPSVHIGNVVQIGLHLNSKGEFVLDGQVSVPLTPMDELVGASWDFAFETVLNKAKHKSNYLIVLWQDANGNIMEDDYPIGQPFQINFEHDQWVRRIERIGDGNIIVSVEKQAMAVQSLSTSLPPAPRPTKRVQTSDPEKFVRSYFNAVWQDRNYDYMWKNYLTSTFQASSSPGGYQEYIQWWGSVERVDLNNISVSRQSDSWASTTVNVTFHLKDGRILANRVYSYDLTYNYDLGSWQFDIH